MLRNFRRRHFLDRNSACVSHALPVARHERILLALRQTEVSHASNRVSRMSIYRIGIGIKVIEVIQEF